MNKSLWQPSEKRVRESSLEEFIKFADLKPKKILKNYGNGALLSPKYFGQSFGTIQKLLVTKVKK